MKITFCLAVLLLLPIIGFSQLPAGNLLTKNQYFEIPLFNIENEILLKANLKGEELTFLLDTGAPFFISKAIQEKHNFPVLFKANLSDASGKKNETIVVSVDSLTIGPLIFTDVWAVVIDFGNEAHQCHKFVGNFGSNLLSFLIVQFDLQKNKVWISDNVKLLNYKPSVPYSQASLSSQSDFNFPIVISKNITDTIHFDSGDGALYQISEKVLNKLIDHDSKYVLRKGVGVTSMGSLGRPDETKQYELQTNIHLNNSIIKNGIANNTHAKQSRMGRFLFHYGVVTLDYINKQYAFDKYNTATIPSVKDFGFVSIVDNKKLIVGTVWDGSEAARKGLHNSCEILSINGVDFSKLSTCDVVQVAKREIETYNKIKLTFLDKTGKEKVIRLTK